MSSQYTPSSRLDDDHRSFFESDEETATSSDSNAEVPLQENSSPLSPPSCWRKTSCTKLPASPIHIIHVMSCFQQVSVALLPSFLRPRASPCATSTTKSSKCAIAALDGLRGIACLFVFNEHFTYNYSHNLLYGYGVEGRRSVVQWPFIRVFWSGFSMVAIFFVISGYVLSYKPLRQIRARQAAQLQHALASSVFRRAIRLYLPSMIAVVICGLLTWTGAFTYATGVTHSEKATPFQLHESTPPHYDSFVGQLGDAIKNAWWMTFFWRWDSTTTPGDYDLHLWTIPTEFRCSMVLFLTLIATSRLRT